MLLAIERKCAVVGCALLCIAVHCCADAAYKAHALHSTICQHALSIVSTVRPALRAIPANGIHRNHGRITTLLLVASGDAVSETPLMCVFITR